MQKDQALGDEVVPHPHNMSQVLPATSIQGELPSLPIMAATRLQLELLFDEPVIDLKSVTEVVLTDAGATLQILRIIGEEFPDDAHRPKRIEDCIVSLSLARCYQTICDSQIAHSGPHVAEWQRCRRVAECVRELASTHDSITPEEGYLVGLLCRLGTFPELLGWKNDGALSSESEALGIMLAFHWRLPPYVLQAIQEQHRSEGSSAWKEILTNAHQLVEQRASGSNSVLS